jgi:homoserine kinase
MEEKKITVYAPASIANMSAGFDVLGVALASPGDFVTVKRIPKGEFLFTVETTLPNIPTSIEKNIAAHVASLMLAELKPDFSIEMILHKMMPIGSGIGSSAASCAAAAFAVNALLPHPLAKKELLPFAVEGERLANGVAHADNVAPSLFGGACIIRNEDPMDVISFPVHNDVVWIVVTPHLSIITATAREGLPQTLPLTMVSRQMGNSAGMVVGLMQGNANIIQDCAVDHIAEPFRQSLVPGFAEMKQAAHAAGAIACGISGSGPALFAITLSKNKAEKIAANMIATLFKLTGINADSYISTTNAKGATTV